MIGVPETLRKITFEAIVDNMPKKQIITFDEPMPTSSYILTTTTKNKNNYKTKTTTKQQQSFN
jgi:hypothetical protein